MKKLLLTLGLLALAFTAQAQTTTNLDFRVRVETVTGGVTNTVTTNFRYDYGASKKETLRIDSLAWAFAAYRAQGGQNDFGAWLKQEVADHSQAYVSAKQQVDNAATLAKLTLLLTSQSDLLSASDLSNLATIAAKAP